MHRPFARFRAGIGHRSNVMGLILWRSDDLTAQWFLLTIDCARNNKVAAGFGSMV